jgi:MFS family permease
LFAKIKSEGKVSKNPIRESFGKKENLGLVLLALFGATAGQGVVWYTGQFYAMTFIEKTCSVEFIQTRNIIAIAILLGTPFFVYFGWLSDRIGRKMIMMLGMLIAVVLYRPIYKSMYDLADVSAKKPISESQVVNKTTTKSDDGSWSSFTTTETALEGGNKILETKTIRNDQQPDVKKEVVLSRENFIMMIALVFAQVLLVTMVYGPIAAFLVELFPTRIRYTSMSLPYHIGNGVFGGLVPFVATSLYEASKTESQPLGDPFAGLWYPIIVAGICFIIGMLFLQNRRQAEAAD